LTARRTGRDDSIRAKNRNRGESAIRATNRVTDLSRWWTEHPFRVLALLCAISFVLRAAVVLLRGTYHDDFSNSDIGGIAHRIADGTGFVHQGMPSSFFGPVFVYVWAFFLSFGNASGQLMLQMLQALLLSLAPVGLYFFGRESFGTTAALAGSAIFAFYPELLALPSTMYADTLALALWGGCLGLYAVTRNHMRIGAAEPVLGVAIALLALTKGRYLLLSGLLVLFLAADRRRWATVAIIALTTAIGLAPWVVRNERVHHRFVLLESTTGHNFWIGHNAHATGTGKAVEGTGRATGSVEAATPSTSFPMSEEMRDALRAATTELEWDRVFRDQALADLRADPAREIPLSLKKIAYSWWRDPTSATTRSPAYWAPWLAVLALFVVGAGRRLFVERRLDPLLWTLLAAGTALAVAFFVIPRLRYPVYPIVFLFAGYGATIVLTRVIGIIRTDN
jgi:hypothetical protein